MLRMLEILCYSFCFLLFGLHFYAEDFPHGKLINTAYIHNGYLSVILCINLATFRNDGYLITIASYKNLFESLIRCLTENILEILVIFIIVFVVILFFSLLYSNLPEFVL